jgi:Tol biopolymer transport system component
MPLAAGLRVGLYEIQQPLGAGGMGEVYRARDLKLNRDVAIKVLPHEFTLDPDRVARFTREAQLLASLNHPNIAAIYGFEETPQALVLELVEGPTLADRLEHGPLPLADALAIAAQIADALEAAHEQGIIHRDLKPANVKLRPDGRVKVLDFGLAKLTGAADGPHGSGAGAVASGPANPTYSPTMASPAMTRVGVILGTAAYMSPEQARGRPADKRSDVWAFGCLLYETLTGVRPFVGDDVTSTHAAILERDPSWEKLPRGTPPLIARLLRRCLEKDPRRRVHDIADARLDIEDARAPAAIDEAAADRRARPLIVSWAVSLLAAAALSGFLVWYLKPAPAPTPGAIAGLARFLIAPPEPLAESDGVLTLSRDGRRLAYAAGPTGRQRLFVREIDQFESRPIPGTEGAVSATFSPDGQSLAFLAERRLKTVVLAGGTPLTLRDRVDGAGLNWTSDQAILFNPGTATGIWRIPVNGGEAAVLTVTGGRDNFQRFPELLPNGKALLFSSQGGVADDQIYVASLVTHERRRLVQGSAPHYLPSGHLVYVQAGTLYAVPFDPERLETTGSPVVLLEGIRQARSSAPLIGYSEVGSMVYVATTDVGSNTLVWVDRGGAEQPTGASGRPYAQPRLAPDGRRVVTALRGNAEDLWLFDFARGTSSRVTTDSSSSFPVWSPDGRRLALTSGKQDAYNLYWRPIDGSTAEERLLSSDRPSYPFSWSPDGKTLVFVSVSPTTFQDLWALEIDGRKARPFLETPFREGAPVLSPDGRWIAYVSDESGRFEVYAQPFPGPGEKWPISTEGGNEPVWPRNGHELFYRMGDAMMAVEVKTAPTFSVGKPKRLFEKPYERSVALWANYDVALDGRRLLMVRREAPAQPATHINVVLNWRDELKLKLPVR